MFFKSNWFILFILCSVFVTGVSVRWLFLDEHFAHIDDVGVARTILERQEYMSTAENRVNEWRISVLNGDKNKTLQPIIRSLDQYSLLYPIAYSYMWWRHYLHAVPGSWTYAPGQFYLTNLLIHPGQSYIETKFWGRLPSFLFNVFALAMMVFLFFKLYCNSNLSERLKVCLLGCILLSFSWQNIIYSSQMESYAIVSFCIIFIILQLLYLLDTSIATKSKAFIMGAFICLPGLFQYQSLFFLPPLVITFIIMKFNQVKGRDLIGWCFYGMLGFGTIFLALIWPHVKGNSHAGITWNAGPSREFVLTLDWEEGIVASLLEFVDFFYINFQHVIGAMISPVSYYSDFHSYIGWCLTLLGGVGFLSMLNSQSHTKRAVAIFSLLSAFVWLTLLLVEIIPFSPTRHSMIIGTLFMVLVVEGIVFFDNFVSVRAFNVRIGGLGVISLTFIFVWFFAFVGSINTAYQQRQDPFNEVFLSQQFQNDNVDLIVTFDSSYQVYLMPSILQKYPVLDANVWIGTGTTAERLEKNMSNHGVNDLFLSEKKELVVAILSSWQCFTLKNKDEVNSIINRYNLPRERVSVMIVDQDCRQSPVQVDWSQSTSNGTNGFNYTILKLLVI